LLNPSSPDWSFAGVTIDSPNCGLQLYCAPSSAGGAITVASLTYAACTPSSAGTTFTIGGVSGASPTLSTPPQDPCPYIAGCEYLTDNTPSTSPCTDSVNFAGGSHTIDPGCYSTFSCAGCTLTLDPGLYVMNTSVSCAGCTITGSGVTIYAASGSFSLAGVTYTLSPPTTGNYANVLYYQPSSNTSDPSFAGGSGSTLSGLVYAPSATLSIAGSLDQYALLVASSLSVAGGSLSLTGPPVGGSLLPIAQLAE
jgi:hypothetical protein